MLMEHIFDMHVDNLLHKSHAHQFTIDLPSIYHRLFWSTVSTMFSIIQSDLYATNLFGKENLQKQQLDIDVDQPVWQKDICRNHILNLDIDGDKPVGQKTSAESTSCNLPAMLTNLFGKTTSSETTSCNFTSILTNLFGRKTYAETTS
jgi:hypothetical protein